MHLCAILFMSALKLQKCVLKNKRTIKGVAMECLRLFSCAMLLTLLEAIL